ncbi:energy-coupling factor ABC transporter ATP-binding protein [Paracoccus seriniphilus]|uniref:energy-coupling factor ABC transporter ATP-binding protein n=1 Tax=Paracoccus seriniphilus TaxID=184748 RepID=UPI0035685D7B
MTMQAKHTTAGMTENARPMRVTLEGVTLRREGREVLTGLNLDLGIRRMGVVGRNGSGKSTLARVLAGLIRPTDGRARLNGADMYADRRAALRTVGILFQNPDHQIIFPTVLEEIAFGLTQLGRSSRDAERDARATLTSFHKSDWAEVAISTLSQGQKHLVCLMSIMAMAPRVLILDEPFAGLDMPTRAQLRRYLQLFPGAVIHISHDPQDLDGCETVIWLEKGRIVQQGNGPEVMASYLAEMTRLGESDDISDLTR